jgi:hypothetical protein
MAGRAEISVNSQITFVSRKGRRYAGFGGTDRMAEWQGVIG